jgi:hypothetical protein
LNKWFFSSNITKTPKRQSIEKREKKCIEERRKRKKEEEKEKLKESLQIKGKPIF